MYPDLSYFLYDLFGIAPDGAFSVVKTFGLFLALSFLLAGYLLYLELKRKEGEGLLSGLKEKSVIGEGPNTMDIVWSVVTGFIIGAKVLFLIQHFELFRSDAVGVIFSTKGSLIGGILGAALFGGSKYWTQKKEQLPKPKTLVDTVMPSDRVGDFVIVAAISGILGAKVFAIIEEMDQFWADPIGTFFSGSGLAIYGGLIGGFIGVYLYLRKYKIPVIHVMDATAPALIVATLITGRIGCQLSGDGDWGIVAAAQPDWWMLPDWLWSFDYPRNVNKEGIPIEGCEFDYCRKLVQGVYPTPLYENIMGAIMFAIAWFLRKRIKVAGVLFFIYLIMTGIERYLIEIIRVNNRYASFFNLTQAQIIAIGFVLVGIIAIFILYRRAKKVEHA